MRIVYAHRAETAIPAWSLAAIDLGLKLQRAATPATLNIKVEDTLEQARPTHTR